MPDWKAIVAMAENRVIGNGNRLPWRLPEDFRWFQEATWGGLLVMGRRTYESIGRPLPGRETWVVSRSGFAAPGVRVFPDLESLDRAAAGETRTVWVCGGADVYRQLLPRCRELYLTRVRGEFPGEAFFPDFEGDFEDRGVVRGTAEFSVHHYVRRPGG
ncbi:MAG: dihydrofolate reductase [Verrucomicrobiota bacterium]